VPLIGVSKFALTPYSLCTQFVIPPPSWGEAVLTAFQGLGSEASDAEYCYGGGSAFIVGVQGDLRAAPTILRRSFSDTAWINVGAGITRDGTFLGVSAPSSNVIYACGTDGMIWKSSNGGDAWFNQNPPTLRTLHAIYFSDENHGFAVGDSGVILHTSNGGLTGIEDRYERLPAEFMLEQNYPNPFNPTTNVRFSIPYRQWVTLNVYDILGREVATLVNGAMPPGSHIVRFDAAGLSSGVYWYRMCAGDYMRARKLLVLK
jgi:hypothetical protein